MSNISGSALGAPSIIPETMFAGNMLPQQYYQGINRKTLTARHSNISAFRKTNISQTSLYHKSDNNGGSKQF